MEEMVKANTNKKIQYSQEFQTIFHQPLFKFFHPLFGFDCIKFDEEFIKPPDGVSTFEQVQRDYGLNAVKLVECLIA